jgi:hypothetical protein
LFRRPLNSADWAFKSDRIAPLRLFCGAVVVLLVVLLGNSAIERKKKRITLKSLFYDNDDETVLMSSNLLTATVRAHSVNHSNHTLTLPVSPHCGTNKLAKKTKEKASKLLETDF